MTRLCQARGASRERTGQRSDPGDGHHRTARRLHSRSVRFLTPPWAGVSLGETHAVTASNSANSRANKGLPPSISGSLGIVSRLFIGQRQLSTAHAACQTSRVPDSVFHRVRLMGQLLNQAERNSWICKEVSRAGPPRTSTPKARSSAGTRNGMGT